MPQRIQSLSVASKAAAVSRLYEEAESQTRVLYRDALICAAQHIESGIRIPREVATVVQQALAFKQSRYGK